jgi:hypothetical protein
MRSLRCIKKKVEKKFLHRKKDRETVIGYTFRVGYIYRADCNIIMLFTCTLVRSHPDSKEGVRCETPPTEINSKILGRVWQQDACSERGTRRRLSLSLQRGHERHIREVLQEDGSSSMYKS